jgi:F-type H+-transporting ATPase subunit gamma
MASTRQLKGRIRSVKSTKQITKAMQMVAASKMRRAQDATRASAEYTQSANELLAYLASQGATAKHPLFQVRPIKSRLLIVIAADKGLAGAYNTNVMKAYITSLKSDDKEGVHNMTISVGRKASQFVTRIKDTEIIGTYTDLPDHPEGSEFYAILDTACQMFSDGKIDAVDLIYTRFVSSMTQTAVVKRVLPAGYTEQEVSSFVRDATYEPSTEVVLEGVARRLVGAQIFQALLDARASEHSMRMLAMKNATDNATDLADDLTLEMNKARQAAITQELAEISGGSEAMK